MSGGMGMGGMGGMGMGGMGGGMSFPMSSPSMMSNSKGSRSSKRLNKYGGSDLGFAQADCGAETGSSIDTKAAPSTLAQTENSNALF